MTTLSSLLPPANLGNVTGTLPVANGGTGLTSPGTSGNILTSNGTAWVSQAPTAGGPSLEAIASGSLSDGSTVVVNADGTVSVVAGAAQTVGTPTVFNSGSTDYVSATYDSAQQKVVVAYANNSTFTGSAVVGTVSGTTISFGTPVVFNAATTYFVSATYDAAQQKIVIAYSNGGNASRGTAIVGTVSGTSITFGTPVLFRAAQSDSITAVYDAGQQKIVVFYEDYGNSRFGTAQVGTVSGTSISFGTAVVFESQVVNIQTATYDSVQQKAVAVYRDSSTLQGVAKVGTVSGTSISFGAAAVFLPSQPNDIAATYDGGQQKVVVACNNVANSSFGTAIVGTVSGTSISFGTPVVYRSASVSRISVTYDANAQKVVIAYRDAGNSNFGRLNVGTVSGTSSSFEAPVTFQSSATLSPSTTYDSAQQKVVIGSVNASSQGTGTVFQNQSTNLTAENFIGFSDGAYTNGQTATVQIAGAVDDAQSSLTAGQSYYVQLDGSLGLSPASPSVFAGTAVSASKIIVKR